MWVAIPAKYAGAIGRLDFVQAAGLNSMQPSSDVFAQVLRGLARIPTRIMMA